MSQSKANPSESHDGMTWESLKTFHRTSNFVRPKLQQSDGLELVGKINSLVHATHTACKEFRETVIQSGDQGASALELERQIEHLTPLWYEVFNCVCEAEKWFSDTFGPAQSTLHLDSIAESMNQLFMMISECDTTEWEIGDDKEDALEDTLQKLHDIACELESSSDLGARDPRRLSPEKEEFAAEVLTAKEYFTGLPKGDPRKMNRREIAKYFGIPFEKNTKTKRCLKSIEKWERKKTGKEYMRKYKETSSYRLYMKSLESSKPSTDRGPDRCPDGGEK